jgi:hypothetical protein
MTLCKYFSITPRIASIRSAKVSHPFMALAAC